MADWISGSGKPRIIIVLQKQFGHIIASSVANPSIITTLQPHKMVGGMRVRIMGHSGSTPAINDTPYTIGVTGEKTFSIPVNVTVAGTGGMFEALTAFYESSGTTVYSATGITETGAPGYTSVFLGMRVSSYSTVAGVDWPTFAKITAKDTGILTVDFWTNGTPTNGKPFLVDGWVVDLPYCQADGGLKERFTSDQLVHNLYAGDTGSVDEVKYRGWIYEARLDYSKYISADTLISMSEVFAAAKKDRLILIPRIDKPQFQYNVRYLEPIEIQRYGKTPGYKGTVFSFKSLENLPGWPIENGHLGYGSNYAANYGQNL